MRRMIGPFVAVAVVFAGHSMAAAQAPLQSAAGTGKPAVARFPQNPIIRPEMIPGTDAGEPAGVNITFPSLIRTPEWLPNRLGKYYLYFASHHGTYIRMAYADRLEGPWKIYGTGVLKLEDVLAANGIAGTPKKSHCASPDAHVDETNKQIRLYFHSQGAVEHSSSVAISSDGLNFKPMKGALGKPYFRVFLWRGGVYAVDGRAMISRSKDGLGGFEIVSNALDKVANEPKTKEPKDPGTKEPKTKEAKEAKAANKKKKEGGGEGSKHKETARRVRHCGVTLDGDVLTIFYSRMRESPESIMMTRIHLNGNPETWVATTPVLVLAPEKDYEGANLPLAGSRPGTAGDQEQEDGEDDGEENAVRDPYVYTEDGKRYLLYTVAGEKGIAIAEF